MKKMNSRELNRVLAAQFDERTEIERVSDAACWFVLVASAVYFATGIARWYFGV